MSNSNRFRTALVIAGLVIWATGAAVAAELDGPVSIVYDQFRVPTIVAETEHDAIYMQGYMHAKDRFFQMDTQRRAFAGTLSELVGPAGLPQDVQLRTLGIARAAERSLPVQTPEIMAWLEAYSDGVNAWLTDTSNPLPIEYGPLEIDRNGIPLWTPLDSLITAKGLAWQLSFDLSDIDRTIALLNFLGLGPLLGFNGLQLVNDDLYRTAPFEAALSIPPSAPAPLEDPEAPDDEELPAYLSDPNLGVLINDYRAAIADIPILQQALKRDSSAAGSNWWILSGALTESGYPMIANDPHLSLSTPSVFYEVHLNVTGGINVTGSSFPGAPGIVLGCNDTICWGATVNDQDVTDLYNEVLIPLGPDPTQPTHTLYEGVPEPIQFIPQVFNVNIIGNGIPNTIVDAGVPANQGGVTLVVPRRNNGPIAQVSVDLTSPTPITGVSVMYVGWSATQELECFRRFARADSMQNFKDALQFFDVGSQNWAYADVNGNIAYYTSGEVPIRQDLQTRFFPAGLQPPNLIRDGTNANQHDWLPVLNPQPHQALNNEILRFDEMPQIENPAAGYVLNANNDPIGTTFDNVSWNQFRFGFNGALYLGHGYATGYRMGRLQRLFDGLLAGGGKLSRAESIDVQANNQLLDAEVLTPYILDAYANATDVGAAPELVAIVSDPRVGDAAARLAAWDFSTPTGINEGFDPGDVPGVPGPPAAGEADASVAATIYAMWRGQFVQRVIDHTMKTIGGVCTGDFATLCSTQNDTCSSGPGGICYAVDLLSNPPFSCENACVPGSDGAMATVRRLLENYPINGGTGVSLINFFHVPGVADQNVARDIILLQALVDGLDLLASNDFAPAFGNSTDLDDYNWGRLHRIVFAHPLGGPFNIPPSGILGPDLPGFPRAGGMGAVDASAHSARADGLNDFMFGDGPARRFQATMTPDCIDALEVIPGGESGQPGNPHGTDQLGLWLVNAYKPLYVCLDDVLANAADTETFVCGDGVVGPGEQCDDGNTNDNDGCNQLCRITPIITCLDPTVPADPLTCTAAVACDAIATCVDPAGGGTSTICAPSGPYALGSTNVTVQCNGTTEVTVFACQTTVIDTTPPSISVGVSPDELWPPNHRMINVGATVTAADTCGPTSVVLESVASDEPDNGTGIGDGDTDNDIQHADIGTEDYGFKLRAERAGTGDGRVYTITYVATDASGNQASGIALVTVPHDDEPLLLSLDAVAGGALMSWTSEVETGLPFNVIRTNLADLQEMETGYHLGNATCIESASLDQTTVGFEDPAVPAPGEVFIYMVEYDGGGYGTPSAAKPRVVDSGDCQ